ncbi:DUF111 family protein [Candidatus Aerophobetes bacterium]|uniref:DUF111 family protein n=1 Tax=Aerophobetes bacterium TaxID=2030807 RepID=A0A523UZJ9_UNCAE|nr:MAG: DUF111 family protein [Candidatus Aerophobetes bacterium]
MREEIYILETNVDDVDGEILGTIIEDFTNEGALDISILPCISKKNRPSHLIRVICHEKYYPKLVKRLMKETGCLGVRVIRCERFIAERDIKTLKVRLMGKERSVRVKVSRMEGEEINVKAEFEDLRRLSRELGLPLRKLREEVMRQIREEPVQ